MKYTISALIIATLLGAALPASAAGVSAGSLVRGSASAVYYVTSEGTRLGFPDEKTYFTWYKDFSGVKFISDKQLASYQLAGQVTYRPGSRLLKLPTATTVYAVAHNGVLRPIQNQNAVLTTYGSGWIKFVDDLPEAFFVNYKIGLPIYSPTDFSPSAEYAAATTIGANRSDLVVTPPSNATLKTASVGPASVSGRMISLAVDPTNENTAYAGSASGGVWKTVNQARTWVSLTDRLNSMHIASLAIDPSNPAVIYAGTGETYMPGDDWAYMGIYVSRDAGVTWNILPSTANIKITAASSIAVDPKNPSHLLVSGNTGVYASTDAGATWNKTLDGFVEQLMFSDAAPSTVFATGASTNLWRSTDGGRSWQKLVGWNANRGLPDDNPWFNRVTITQSSGKTIVPNVKHVLYVVFADPFRIYRSDDEGDSWHDVARQMYDEKNYAVAADPTDADVVFTAGNQIRRATEGGWTVTPISAPLNNVRAIAFAPSNPKVIYAASNTGIEVSSDGGFAWQARSSGLNTTQWSSVAVSRDGMTVWGAVADLSVLRRNNHDGSWTNHSWGIAAKLVADPLQNQTIYAISSDSKGVGISTDNGETFSQINSNLPTSLNWTVLAVDPAASGSLYIASGPKVYGTNDSGREWYLYGDNGSSSDVTSIAVSSQPRRVFVGRADGTIDMVMAVGSGANNYGWTTVYREPNKKPVADMSAGNIAITFALDANWGTRVGRLTLNAKNGWDFSDLTGSLPDGAWLRSLAVDPSSGSIIYVGHRAGAFRGVSADGKTWNWSRTEDGLPSVEVTDIAVSKATGAVYYATWGRGLYEVMK
jgi:photosystem II stability/assembly factor-like uncharacterized protein